MEYIKKELIEGEIYYVSTTYDFWMIGLVTKSNNGDYSYNSFRGNATYIDKETKELIKDSSWCYEASGRTYRLATSEEKHWLTSCITADKFVTFEEAMKTFTPEYYEYINKTDTSWKFGKIYKIDENGKFHFESGTQCMFGGYATNTGLFKPSTKEAYDTQFVVKEPEFVLPEKWCIFRNNEYFEEIGKWFNKINNCVDIYTNSILKSKYPYLNNSGVQGECLSVTLIKDYTEITFEQFKKHVLKEEIVIEEVKIIEPLPQFKVIETIETITKVENNEGNQFFIGDIVKSETSIIQTIRNFKYNSNKTGILAITDKSPIMGVNINKIEHYIEPKVIEPEFILPEKWFIKTTEETFDIIRNWANKMRNSKTYDEYSHHNKVTFNNEGRYRESRHRTEITFDQFQKYVLKEEVKEETLLEKAKRLYPIGTKFKAARGNGIRFDYKVTIDSEFKENSDGAICIESQGNGTIYFNGKWAEIIE